MEKLSALSNIDGRAVDWWFMYKYPDDVGKPASTGFEFLYSDALENGVPALSTVTLDHDQCAVALTLAQIFGGSKTAGYVLWNDEIPPTEAVPNPVDNGGKAHSKGILGFDKSTDSGFYLLHSTPRFPAAGEDDLPTMEDQYGQTYLCISVDYATANQIAEVLRCYHDVQVYASVLTGVDASESIAKLGNGDNTPIPTAPAIVALNTRGGQAFTFFGKNKRWSEPAKKGEDGLDFWSDLVGPTLKVSMNVETWRRGTVFTDVDNDGIDDTQDVLKINLAGIGIPNVSWDFTKDHAKWGISEDSTKPYVVIADINRNVSQENRGGGGLCFLNPVLWKAMDAIEISETSVVTGDHLDSTK